MHVQEKRIKVEMLQVDDRLDLCIFVWNGGVDDLDLIRLVEINRTIYGTRCNEGAQNSKEALEVFTKKEAP